MMHEPITVDGARCAHDTIDGETMVIDTATGHLLLLAGLGPVLWDELRVTTTRAELVTRATELYGADAGIAVGAFVDELVSSGLVVTATGVAPPPSGGGAMGWPAAFEAPELARFEDIADIMAMDPIHEVDTSLGWPTSGTGLGA